MSSQKALKAAHRKRQKQLKSLSVIGIGGILLILAAVFLIKAAQPGPKAALEVAGSPALKVDKENVDLGYVKLGKTVDVNFTLTNVGDQPLKLSEAPYIEVIEGC
jgi:hypothetical protein